MSVYKCKMCGGALDVRENESVGTCEYCGTQQTIATTQDEALQGLFNRANILRMKSEFDKAESLYEKIIQAKPDEAEAYWGLILCRYGIEYVEDPQTFKSVPTCHRTSFDSVVADEDYKAALQYADAAQRALYEAEAKEIDRLQKEILALSQKEDPYDVFICYKETDESGRRTPDSVIANDIYHQLTQEGFKVFYAAISLENKLGSAYEPCIFAALNSAKVMLVVGTKEAYFNAVWVKNEWSRYLKLMKTDRTRILIPCYRDMDAYELPEEFAHLQAQDMSKIGFINDVVRGIKKVLRRDTPAAQSAAAPVSANAAAAQPLIDRGYMALEDKEWAKADEFFEQALNLDAKNGDAYLGKFLVSVKTNSFEGFLKGRASKSYISSHISKPKKEAFRLKDGALQAMVNDYVVPGYLDEKDLINELSAFDKTYASDAGQMEQYIAECRSGWASDKNLLRAKQYGKPEISTQLDAFFSQLEQEFATAKQAESTVVTEKKKDYEQFVQNFQAKMAQRSAEAQKHADSDAAEQARLAAEERAAKEHNLNEKYQAAIALAAKADSPLSYDKAIKAFQLIPDYKDSEAQIKTLQERQDRVAAQIAKEEAIKKKRNAIIAACIGVVLVIALTAMVVVTKVVLPNNKYEEAVKLMNDGQYNEAISAFTELDGLKDCDEKISECEKAIDYNDAIQLMSDGQYSEAISAFEALDGFKDSKNKISECKNLIVEREYNGVIQLMKEGSPLTAYQMFLKLEDYKDAKELAEKCRKQGLGQETISAGQKHTVGLNKDGTVVAVGDNEYGQCRVSGWKDIIAISAGDSHTVGLKKDGTVVATGAHDDGQCDVSGWTDIVAVSAGDSHTVGLKKDGTVVAVGENTRGQCDVSGWKGIIAISAGGYHTVGLKKDGTVVAVGENDRGQCDVSEWKDIIAISAGGYHTVGLKKDGTAVAIGSNAQGQCDVSRWKNIIAISAGTGFTVGLKKDGTAIAVGYNSDGQCNVSSWENIIAIGSGLDHTAGLKKDGTVVAIGWDFYDQCDVSDWQNIKLP